MQIRVSIGTAGVLGLSRAKQPIPPTTGYLMTYAPNGCIASCSFCPQSKYSESNLDLLSRISWPIFRLSKVVECLQQNEHQLKRICIQTVNYSNVLQELHTIIQRIKTAVTIPISLSVQPLSKEQLAQFHYEGVDTVGIPLDAATPFIFNNVKGKGVGGPYRWDYAWDSLDNARQIFGPWKTTTHLIIGLGETEREAIEFIEKATKKQVNVGLFSFTPIQGTPLSHHKQPEKLSYRKIQLARSLILKGYKLSDFTFDNGQLISFRIENKIIREIIKSGEPFKTSGCPHCNRPYYNERPSDIPYNYPIQPTQRELEQIWRLLMNETRKVENHQAIDQFSK